MTIILSVTPSATGWGAGIHPDTLPGGLGTPAGAVQQLEADPVDSQVEVALGIANAATNRLQPRRRTLLVRC